MIDNLLPLQVWVPIEMWLRGLSFFEFVGVTLLFYFVVVYGLFALADFTNAQNNHE